MTSSYPPPHGGPVYAPDHPRATVALVLGILSLVLCQVLGPVAWVIGGNTLKEIDASGGGVGGRGQASAGRILGIIATALLCLSLVVLVLLAFIGDVAHTSFQGSSHNL
jgi:hypothetical protein